jgi:hypothetical protein
VRCPADDLIEVALVFRRFALGHRAIFSMVFQRADPALWPRFQQAAADALVVLDRRFAPLADRRPPRRSQHPRSLDPVPCPL